MGKIIAELAERRRTAVYLNLPELAELLAAALEAGAGDRRERDLHSAAQRVERAKKRRQRAVERAGGR